MKQKIYLIGIIFFITTIIGTLFKMMHYPGAGVLMTIGFFGLIFIFFPIGLRSSYRNEENKILKPLYIVTYLTFLIVFTGMLFKIMHWPGAGLLLLIALPFPFVVFLPLFIVVTGRIERFSIYTTVSVLLLLAFISVFNGLLALNVSKEKIDDSIFLASIYHRTALVTANQSINNPIGSDVIKSADLVLNLIREAKDKFMIGTQSDSETLANDPYSLRYTDSKSLPTEIMFRGSEPYLGYRLEKSIDEFIQIITSTSDEKVTPAIARELLEFNTIDGDDRTWSELMFDGDWTSWSLVYLGILEDNVMLLRNELLVNIR